jgi:preprotein translocase subunit SecG
MDILHVIKIIAWVALGVSSVSVMALVLMQQGKGADMGATFGSGASGSLFGATGAANFFSRATAIAVGLFFASCLTLVAIDTKKGHNGGNLGVVSSVVDTAKTAVSGVPASPTVPR